MSWGTRPVLGDKCGQRQRLGSVYRLLLPYEKDPIQQGKHVGHIVLDGFDIGKGDQRSAMDNGIA